MEVLNMEWESPQYEVIELGFEVTAYRYTR